MGKIGDLWVRLGLKSDDYKKGMKDAKKETQSFSGRLKNMKVGALAVWAAVGAGVKKFAKDFIGSTNRLNDAWEQTMSSIKAGYHSMLADLSKATFKFNTSGNGSKVGNAIKNEVGWWRRLFGNAKEAGEAAKEATKAFDAEFELGNSVKLQREAVRGELNELYTIIRDTTLTPADRQAAMEKYKAILEPIANAEIKVYTDMLNAAVTEWQAGRNLSRQYSTAELTDFFTNYGTDPTGMTAKYGELASVYENDKNDKYNQKIVDTILKLQQAQNEMSNIDKEMARAALSIKKSLAEMFNIEGKSTSEYLKAEVSEISKTMSDDIREMSQEITNSIAEMSLEDMASEFGIDVGMESIDAEMKAFLDEWKKDVDTFKQYNDMLEQSIIQSTSNGMQALTDMMFGLEGADMKGVLAAFLAPFGDTMKQMGSMIMAEGVAMMAFKKSFSNPYAAIAAGAALIAVGSLVSSGLQRLTQNPTGGSGGTSASGGSYGSQVGEYESTLTVEVVGRISGNDIVISGNKTNSSNAR